MNAIELNNICKKYKGFEIKDLSLNIEEGTICGLVGENGAGKSTLIKILMGAIKANDGQSVVLGCDSLSNDFAEVKQDIGVVLDDSFFPECMKASDVNNIMKDTYINWDSSGFYELCKKMDLPVDKPFKNYSRGMRMKLAIAVALSHQAKLLVLDEATAGLDPVIRDEILDYFIDFSREPNHSILISSHIVSDLEKICDSIAFVHNGCLLVHENVTDLLDDYRLLQGDDELYQSINQEAIVNHEINKLGVHQMIVKKDMVPDSYELEKTTIEEIILAIVKGGKNNESLN